MSFLISDKARIWMREESQKHFYYGSISNLLALLKEKKKIFTVSLSHKETQIISCEFSDQTDLYELKSFSGSKIIIGKDVLFHIDSVWVPLHDIKHHEKITEFNILNNHFKESYAIKVSKIENCKSYKISTQDHTIVINNFLIKLSNE